MQIVEGDITPVFENAARDSGVIAWDIETSGLDWSRDRIGTCQIHVPGLGTQIIQVTDSIPERLRELLSSEATVKVFHHAPFDLRFMSHHWGVSPQAVGCTKILSKIVSPGKEPKEYSLKPTLQRYLHVDLDKSQQTSDWLASSLNKEQINYAAQDVEYLVPLFARLMGIARSRGLADMAERTFAYLPTRIETDLRGCGDVFAY
ncbi:3'-5' exonuclease [Kocuria dechangensis]|uniref:3'-5' exonuclease n=1 Tax=Kocuria dechangensis TaxID=1176249 RepID=A0A917LPL7_9MICC|nr:3'-5' exonuclease [Kocuria dechangensis]